MKGLYRLNVRGLRMFQNILFVIGFLMIPILFINNSMVGKYILSITFILLFLGFRKAEKVIAFKTRLGQTKVKTEKIKARIEKELEILKLNFIKKGMSINLKDNVILKNLYENYLECSTLEEFESLSKRIKEALIVLAENNKKAEKESKKSSIHEPSLHSDTSSQYLQVLGLPVNTRDKVKIKQTYRNLVKKYHPDINPSPSAEQKIIEINLAYEYLKKDMQIS